MHVRRAAFTVVELLVVIAIVATLAVLVTIGYRHFIEGSRSTTCLSNLRALGTGLNAYLGEHDFIMPKLALGRASLTEEVDVIDTVLLPYLQKERRVFICPSDTHKRLGEKTGTSYAWNVALNSQPIASLNMLQLTEDPTRIPVMFDKEGFHPYVDEKVNILYADGHASKQLVFK